MLAILDDVSPTTPTPEQRGPVGRFWLRRLNDPRDLPFAGVIMQCCALACGAVGLFFAGAWFWPLAAIYLVAWLLTIDRYILMLHCVSHLRPFKPRHRVLNLAVGVLLAPFMGQTPYTYFAHHIGMHHPENNLARDRSTTMPFQRDRFSHWLRYFGRFITLGIVDLVRYHVSLRRSKMARRAALGELGFVVGCVALALVDVRATVVVFVAPLVLVRALMMAGNWAQHAFIDGASPESPYRNSITCINTRYNRRCFNDGYHIHHHVRARTHWTEYPAELQQHAELYGREDAIVFAGLDYFQIWVLLMLRRHDRLARAVVRLPGAPARSHEAMVAHLRSRLRPVPAVATETALAA